jgi:ribosome-binding ATPase YchF (GTP1/OBG family)
MNRDYFQICTYILLILIIQIGITGKPMMIHGNKIPNEHRMCYECIKIIKDGAVMPTKAEVEAKIQELKDAEVAKEVKKEEAKAKLLELGLTEEHLKALGI